MKIRGFPTCRPADNPFASARVEALAFRGDGIEPASLLERLQCLGWRAAIVGPRGSGKTTLLETLATEIGSQAFLVSLPGDCRHPVAGIRRHLPPNPGPADVLLLDSAGQLRRHQSWWLSRRWRRVVITSHTPGRLPTLVECRTNPSLLNELISDLAPEHVARLEPMLAGLFERHDGNIRMCFRELYDLFAGRCP